MTKRKTTKKKSVPPWMGKEPAKMEAKGKKGSIKRAVARKGKSVSDPSGDDKIVKGKLMDPSNDDNIKGSKMGKMPAGLAKILGTKKKKSRKKTG